MDAVMTQLRSGWERLNVQFENKITTGAVLQILCMVAGFVVFLLSYEHRITQLEERQAESSRDMVKLSSQLDTIQSQLQGRIIPAGRANELSTTVPPP